MATAGDLITRINFEVRDGSFYKRIGDGDWARVAKRLAVITISFRHGGINVTEAAIPKKASRVKTMPSLNYPSEELAEAVTAVRIKLGQFDNIIDLTRPRFILMKISRATLDDAYGFRARIPGIGQAFVVRPEALRNWFPNSVPVRQAVKQLDSCGYLIRGCDGKLSRQVKLFGLFRGRYYCFKLATAKTVDGAALSTDGQTAPLGLKRPKPTGPFLWND